MYFSVNKVHSLLIRGFQLQNTKYKNLLREFLTGVYIYVLGSCKQEICLALYHYRLKVNPCSKFNTDIFFILNST